MANTRLLTDGKAGANIDERSTVAKFKLGTIGFGEPNATFIYGQASEAVTGTCTVNPTTFLITDAAGQHTADVAFAANEYGWVRQTATVHT